MKTLNAPTKLMTDLTGLARSTLRETLELQTAALRTHLATNQEYLSRLAGETRVSVWLNLGRDCREAVDGNVQTALEDWGNVLRQALENAGAMFQEACAAGQPTGSARPR